MHMPSPLPPSPAPRTAHSPAGVARAGDAGKGLAGGLPPGAAGALCRREPLPSPPLPSFCRRRPSDKVQTLGDGCTNLPSPVPRSGWPLLPLPSHPLCSNQGCYFFPTELARFTSRLLSFFFFFLNSQFFLSSLSESTRQCVAWLLLSLGKLQAPKTQIFM